MLYGSSLARVDYVRPSWYVLSQLSSLGRPITHSTGNGKTISIKAIMKSCGDMGFQPLYVKSFQSMITARVNVVLVVQF
jgi:hypothetical protein